MGNTYEEILQRILKNTNIFIDKREGSFVSNMASPVAYELSKVFLELEDILKIAFIETNYDTYLERRVNEYGLYRKLGTKTYGKILIENKEDVDLYDLSKVTKFIYGDLEYKVIKRENNFTITLEAIDIGDKYNLPIGETLLAYNNVSIAGKIIEKFDNGLNTETDDELRERFNIFIRDNLTSGNKAHYRHWALEVSGVGNAKVYPLWNGNGTVKVLISNYDNLPVTDDILNNCKKHIEEMMPIGCTLTVKNVEPININIEATIKRTSGTILSITEKYTKILKEFMTKNIGTIYYSKLFSLLGELEEIDFITEFNINNDKVDIALTDEQVGVINNITLTEFVL